MWVFWLCSSRCLGGGARAAQAPSPAVEVLLGLQAGDPAQAGGLD